jgi:hypothetical protein
MRPPRPHALLPLVLAAPNRYLVTRSGRFVGSRVPAILALAGPLLGGPLLGVVGVVVGSTLEAPLVAVLAVVLALALFFGGTVAAWVFLLRGGRDVARASQMWLAGDSSGVVLCQWPLGIVFRADVRMRAFYTIGLIAEANGDFPEATDLFRRAYDVVPAVAAQKWKRRGQCMMLSHAAIGLVAIGRLDEADACVRAASSLFLPVQGGGILDALGDDTAFGPAGVTAALRDLEPGREPRVLLTVASAVVLTARGRARDALDLVERERAFLNAGLLPREHALLANIEARSRTLLAGGPMRSPGLASQGVEERAAAWAARVLPTHA